MKKGLEKLSSKEWFIFIIISSAILGSFMISQIKVSVIKGKYGLAKPLNSGAGEKR